MTHSDFSDIPSSDIELVDSEREIEPITEPMIQEPSLQHADPVIPPPSLQPVFNTNFSIQYNVSENLELNFGKGKVTQTTNLPVYNRKNNLKARKHPYNRILEKKNCKLYSARKNKQLSDHMGERFLKAGSVCICYVQDDDTKQIISNPPSFGHCVGEEVHSLVFSKLQQLLVTNPINRQCIDSPYYYQYSSTPVTKIGAKRFVTSAIKLFMIERNVYPLFSTIHFAMKRLSHESLLSALEVLQNYECFMHAGNPTSWTNAQLVAFLTYSTVLYSQYYLTSAAPKSSSGEEKKWEKAMQKVAAWKSANEILGNRRNITFGPGMDDDLNGFSDAPNTATFSSDED